MAAEDGRGASPACPCGFAGPMRKVGLVWTRYRDLSGPGSAEVRERRQRYQCRACRATTSGRPAGVVERFRMTERLADTVAASCLARTFAAVAVQYDLAPRTVREVFASRSEALLAEAGERLPETVALTLHAGERLRILLLHDVDGARMVNAFAPGDEDRLAPLLARLPQGAVVHVDHHAAAIVKRLAGGRVRACIHRESAAESLERLMPDAVRRLLRVAEPRDVPLLREAAPLLALGRYAMTEAEAATLRRLSGQAPLLGLFLEKRERARAIWRTPDVAEARAAERAWLATLDGRMGVVFARMREWLVRWGDDALREGYGTVPARAWRALSDRAPLVQPGDSAHRVVIRTVQAILEEEDSPAMGSGIPSPGF